MRRVVILLSVFVLSGCSPGSIKEFQKEGEAHTGKLIATLQNIKTTEDLVKSVPDLKKRFNDFVDLMIEARMFQEGHPDDFSEASLTTLSFNEQLIVELERVYQLERGKEIIEKTQRDALHRLDAYETKRKKKQEKLLRSQ